MKFFFKKNIFHPNITGKDGIVAFDRVGTSGVIATEDKDTVELLEKVCKETPGALREITEDQYAKAVADQKKITEQKVRRTFFDRPASVDQGRSANSAQKSASTSTEPAPQAVAPALKKAKRAVVSAPTIEPPPGIDGNLDPM